MEKGRGAARDSQNGTAFDQRPAGAEGPSVAVPCGDIVLRVGNIEPEMRIEREFEISGCSDTERKVGRITTSCGCLTCQLDDKVLAVGGSLHGTIAVQPKNVAGRFGTTARIELLGSVPSFVTVKVEGTVVPVVVCRPSQLILEGRDLSRGREVQVLVEDKSGTGVELELVKPLPNWITSMSIVSSPEQDATSVTQAHRRKVWNVAMVVKYDGIIPIYRELKFDVRGANQRSVTVPVTIKPTVSLYHLNPTQFVLRVGPEANRVPKKVILTLPKTLQLNELPRIKAMVPEQQIGTTIRQLESNVFEIEAVPLQNCTNVSGMISVEWQDRGYTASAMIPVIVVVENIDGAK